MTKPCDLNRDSLKVILEAASFEIRFSAPAGPLHPESEWSYLNSPEN